ncbi:MAG: hypothetical protein R6V42_04650 [Orrella sp.]
MTVFQPRLERSVTIPARRRTLAGHRNMATTQRYIDLRPGVLRNAVELVWCMGSR